VVSSPSTPTGARESRQVRDPGGSRNRRSSDGPREEDVGVYSIAPYYMAPPGEAALLVDYSGLAADDIRDGIRHLGGFARQIPP